jgi:hypothetical protein|uniref:Myb 7 protein n=1 Tax=Oryza sativa TaxID=4530 RepID=Q43720_ORYSA|nr:unnamed protein product [Oryza sativa Japonica Group]CAA65523.1 ORF [Oryza sativa Japonica Group]
MRASRNATQARAGFYFLFFVVSHTLRFRSVSLLLLPQQRR